ncbi:MAG: ribokinase [Methylococcales bacterium]|nr:ribokinase [Methylococcales bacterium]
MNIIVLGSFIQAHCWMTPHLPKAGESVIASGLTIEAGGKGLNVAIGIQRLGVQVDVLLGIGLDLAGDNLLQLLQKEGLSIEYVWRLAAQSGYGAGLIAADGQNTIAVYPGPNLLLTTEHIQYAESSISTADLVYGQLETSLAAVTSAFRIARLNGVRTVLNPSPWQILPQSLLDDTDVLIVNEVETQELFVLDKPLNGSLQDCIELLRPLLDSFWLKWRASLLVITLGSVGSLAFERNGAIHSAPAYEITAIDSVGAGDAFASGLCVALGKHTPLPDALRYANACGAYTASHFGVLDSLPSHVDLHAFFKLA